MPKPKMPEPADEKTKWQRNSAFNLEFYKKKSKDLENEAAATMPKSAAPPPPPPPTGASAAASSSSTGKAPPWSKGVEHRGEMPKTPAEDHTRLRLGGGHAPSFVPQKHIAMVCGRPVVVPGSCKAPRWYIFMRLSLPSCAETSSSLCLLWPFSFLFDFLHRGACRKRRKFLSSGIPMSVLFPSSAPCASCI